MNEKSELKADCGRNTKSIKGVVSTSVLLFCLFLMSFESSAKNMTISVFEEHDKYLAAADTYSVSWQLFELAAKRANIDLIIEESAWKSAMQRLKAQKVDFMFAVYKTADREKWADFSMPLVSDGSAIFARLSSPVRTLEEIDFSQSIIGVSAQSVQERLAQDLGFQNIYLAVQRPQLYDMLRQNRIDYLMFGRSAMRYYCVYYANKPQDQCTRQIGPLFEKGPIHVIADKQNKNAVAALKAINKEIFNLTANPINKKLFDAFFKGDSQYKDWIKNVKLNIEKQ